MNQIFSFKRYWWLVKRQWYENAAIYKWGIVLMMLVNGLMFWLLGLWKTVVVAVPQNFPQHIPFPQFIPSLKSTQELVFFVSVIVFWFIYGANFFESLTSKHKKMFYFSLPVSRFERIVVTLTFVMVFMPVVLLTVFSVFDFIAIQLFNHIHGVSEQMLFKSDKLFGFPNFSFIVILFVLSIISMSTLGSLLFGKKGPIISIIAMLFFIISFYIPIETKTIVTVEPSRIDTIKRVERDITSVMGLDLMTFDFETSGHSWRVGMNTRNTKKNTPIITLRSLVPYTRYNNSNELKISLEQALEIYETEGISETVETSKVLSIIFKILYAFTAPFCWLMMYFIMKRKEA